VIGELRTFIRFNRKSLPDLPDFPKVTFQEPPIRSLSEKEQDRVFEFIADERDLKIFTFMRQYGCRENEASELLRENVFINHDPPYFALAPVLGANGQIKPTTKTKRLKVLPIIPEIEWVFKPSEVTPFVFSKSEKLYTNRMLNRIWNRANKEAHKKYGIQVTNLYNAMRHSFGCQRLNDGFSLDKIKTVMGHTSTKTTQRYAQYKIEKLEDVIRGKSVHRLFIPPGELQVPEDKEKTWLGGKDSNLG